MPAGMKECPFSPLVPAGPETENRFYGRAVDAPEGCGPGFVGYLETSTPMTAALTGIRTVAR
jgi:hypothetical protein